jgi:hypothetical protein
VNPDWTADEAREVIDEIVRLSLKLEGSASLYLLIE